VSLLLKQRIKTKYISYNKKNIKKWLLINFRTNFISQEHLIDRYFYRLKKYNILNDKEGVDYFIPSTINKNSFPKYLPFENTFFAWVLGGTYEHKKLSEFQIENVCSKISVPIFFLGGNLEKKIGDKICNKLGKSNIYNLCGLLSLDESAYILKKSSIVLTNDTGLMHIASAFKKKIISFWGCTKPSLGMFPYKPHPKSIQIVTKSSLYPCSKLGNKCRQSNKGCINKISVEEILIAIKKIGYN
jgi:ADP-heptose:LPS heptosyltransferase